MSSAAPRHGRRKARRHPTTCCGSVEWRGGVRSGKSKEQRGGAGVSGRGERRDGSSMSMATGSICDDTEGSNDRREARRADGQE